MGPEKVCVRCPVIPDFTDEEDREQGIARLLSEIHPALRVERFTYIRR